MAATPRYTTSQDLPYLIEVGRDTVLTCPVYVEGSLVAPSSGTVSVFDHTNTAVVDAAAVTVSAQVAQYTVTGATTSSLDPSSGWRVEWTLAGLSGAPDDTVLTSSAYLVRRRLYPTISDVDIARRVPALATSFEGRPTLDTSYQGRIEEADAEIQRRLILNDRRPWLLADPWALRECWLTLTIALIYESLIATSAAGDPYIERAQHYRTLFEAAWSQASSEMDWDQDGAADSRQRTAARPSGVWLQ